MAKNRSIILYDNDCQLCHNVVRFLRKKDRRDQLTFLPQSSEEATEIIGSGLEIERINSLVMLDDNNLYYRSEAAIRSIAKIGRGWRLFSVLLLVPRRFRDFGYNLIARNRYKLFGKHDSCSVTTC